MAVPLAPGVPSGDEAKQTGDPPGARNCRSGASNHGAVEAPRRGTGGLCEGPACGGEARGGGGMSEARGGADDRPRVKIEGAPDPYHLSVR